MNDVRVIEVKENILADNDKEAQILRDKLKPKKNFSYESDVVSGEWKNNYAFAYS